MGFLWSLEMKTKAPDIQHEKLSLGGSGSSCSGMHFVGFDVGVTDIPQSGYWAQAAKSLPPSCLCVSMLSGSPVPIRNCLRAVTVGRVLHPFALKQE